MCPCVRGYVMMLARLCWLRKHKLRIQGMQVLSPLAPSFAAIWTPRRSRLLGTKCCTEMQCTIHHGLHHGAFEKYTCLIKMLKTVSDSLGICAVNCAAIWHSELSPFSFMPGLQFGMRFSGNQGGSLDSGFCSVFQAA